MSRSASLDEARAVKAKVAEIFARMTDVVGVGVTRIDGGYGVKVNVRSAPAGGAELPTAVNGVPVRVEVVGSIRKR